MRPPSVVGRPPRSRTFRQSGQRRVRSTRVMLPAVAYDAFYEAAGDDVFVATPATAGPWGADAQHAGPPSALLARAFERHEPVAGQRLSRVTVDILGPVPVAPLTLRVRTVRGGRRITLVEGV